MALGTADSSVQVPGRWVINGLEEAFLHDVFVDSTRKGLRSVGAAGAGAGAGAGTGHGRHDSFCGHFSLPAPGRCLAMPDVVDVVDVVIRLWATGAVRGSTEVPCVRSGVVLRCAGVRECAALR